MQAGQMGKDLACGTWNEPFELGLGGELEVGPRCLNTGAMRSYASYAVFSALQVPHL